MSKRIVLGLFGAALALLAPLAHAQFGSQPAELSLNLQRRSAGASPAV